MDFTKWGIQYVKYEYCNSNNDKRKQDSVKLMKDALGDDVCFSLWAMKISKGLEADFWTISEKTFDSFTSVEYNFKKHFEDSSSRNKDLGLL